MSPRNTIGGHFPTTGHMCPLSPLLLPLSRHFTPWEGGSQHRVEQEKQQKDKSSKKQSRPLSLKQGSSCHTDGTTVWMLSCALSTSRRDENVIRAAWQGQFGERASCSSFDVFPGSLLPAGRWATEDFFP